MSSALGFVINLMPSLMESGSKTSFPGKNFYKGGGWKEQEPRFQPPENDFTAMGEKKSEKIGVHRLFRPFFF